MSPLFNDLLEFLPYASPTTEGCFWDGLAFLSLSCRQIIANLFLQPIRDSGGWLQSTYTFEGATILNLNIIRMD
jgi:hypothetical protein